MKRAASWSSAIINFDAINWRFVPDAIRKKNWHQNLTSNISGTGFCSVYTRL